MTLTDLKAQLDRGEPLAIIDGRDPHEWQLCNLEAFGSKVSPLGQFAARLPELNSQDEIVVHCKMGGRSAEAYQILRHVSFKRKAGRADQRRGPQAGDRRQDSQRGSLGIVTAAPVGGAERGRTGDAPRGVTAGPVRCGGG
jgi:rhodanese-related sulfurtransferase